jgi:chorismate mutase/prephenate dehydratase
VDLKSLRIEIDGVDDSILELLSRRSRLVRTAAEVKHREDLPLRSVEREENILGRLLEQAKSQGISEDLVKRVYSEIIDNSIQTQQLVRWTGSAQAKPGSVVFQGIDGAYSHQAARQFFGVLSPMPQLIGLASFHQVVGALMNANASYGVLPIENTTVGSLTEVYDLLIENPLTIVGEVVLEIDHCLIGLATAAPTKIRRVLSHWQALSQCREFLSGLGEGVAEPFEDTALAVARVKELDDPSVAAIASAEAAQHHDLEVLQRGIADRPENSTRFVVVARQPLELDSTIAGKTSVVIGTEDQPGALYRVLGVLDRLGVNLCKLESRPRKGSRFEYLFFLDLEGRINETDVEEALKALGDCTSFLKVLGSYPASIQSSEPRSPERWTARSKTGQLTSSKRTRRLSRTSMDLEAMPAIEAEISCRLASRSSRAADTVVRIGEVEVGGGGFIVIAGPCAVESSEQILASARWARSQGASLLRGGCFKPRTSPYSFQGLGPAGLELLAAAGRDQGIPVVTEVMAVKDLELVAEHADVLQIGARNMQNFPLLTAVGQLNMPVLLKRGMTASLEEFLNAAEYILVEGNQQVMLCERGIRTFETITRCTLDLSSVAILRRLTHLPIIVDPSHAAGRRDLVAALALAAYGVGPDGLMIEIHPQPDEALSDGPQSLCFEEFGELMNQIRILEKQSGVVDVSGPTDLTQGSDR